MAGTQGPLAANSGPTRTARLSEFYWEQGFLNDRIDITAGRTNPTADFATSAIACTFVSSVICAQPGSWYFSNANQAYPASTWGGRINLAATPEIYFRAGVYDNDPSQFQTNHHGFDWNTDGSTGVLIPAELGYATTFTSAHYPTKVDVGGYYETSSYTTPGGQTKHDRTSIYLQGQQTVWRPDFSTTQSLTAFGGGIVYQGGAPYWTQIYGGLIAKAPFGPVRPSDSLNFIGSYYANNQAFAPAFKDQWIFELNYSFSIVPGISGGPVTQYVVRPNELCGQCGQYTKRPSDAWVIGAQINVDFGALFGLPQFIAY